MTLFPHGLGLLVLLLGIVAQMLLGLKVGVAQGRKERMFVFLIFLVVMIHIFYLSSLSVAAIPGKLFVFSGMEICFAVVAILFLLFSHFNFYFDKIVYEKELGLIQLVTAFFTFSLIFSNHFLILIFSLPLLMLVVFSAPHFVYKSPAKLSLTAGVPWVLLFLIVLSLSAALVFQEYHTLDFQELRLKVIESGLAGPQILAVVAPMILFGVLLLFSSFSFFLRDYERSDSWNLIGHFRMILPLVSAMMICRWVLLFGGVWRDGIFVASKGFSLQLIPMILFLMLSFAILIKTVFVRRLSQLVQIFACQPLLLTLWGLSSGSLSALYNGIAAMFLYALAVPLCLKVFVVLDIKPFENLEGGRLALRGASLLEKFQICALLVILSPLGTYIGYTLIMSTIEPPFSFGVGNLLPAICGASLLFSLVIVLGELFDNYSPRKLIVPRGQWMEQVFGNGLLILLITLGIYPSPLYKYVSYILIQIH